MLDEISFCDCDVDGVKSQVIGEYEKITGRRLARADPVYLFLESVALVIVQQRNLIDWSAKQNLLAYASGDYLDKLAELVGVSRLPASCASVLLKFSLSEPQAEGVLIKKGIRASPGGGDILFATRDAVFVSDGQPTAEVKADCVLAGAAGNDFKVGSINKIVDVFAYEISVENLDVSAGGADLEDDASLRERIRLAPESFSVAGARGAYEFFAKTASADIADVAVVGPPDIAPGYVDLYVLMKRGALPSQEILERVYDVCSADDVRPLTDCVSVKSPELVDYDLDVVYFIDQANAVNTSEISTRVLAGVDGWIAWQHDKLGRDLNQSELIARLVAAGAKRVEVKSPEFKRLKSWQLANLRSKRINYGGLEES